MSFDVEAIRAQFPILAREVNGHPLVYLDSAASAQKPLAVLDAMRRLAETSYANVHRGVHTLAAQSTEAYEAARDVARRFLNAAHREEMIFTRGGTEAINLVAASFLGPRIEQGDEIILTEMEHHSNIVPWMFLKERLGAVIRVAPVAEEGALDLSVLERLFSPRTKMLALTHMSNVLGTVTPIRQITELAHARGVPVLIDGCQGAVHEPVDVQAIGCDFYVATGHKLYGPTAIGLLYGKRDHLKAMRPYQGGGEMIRTVSFDDVTYADPPAKFEAGTPPILEAAGLGAALEWLMAQDRAAIQAHERELLAQANEELGRLNWVKRFGTAPGKGAIVSFEIEGVHAHDVATILDGRGIAVRAGHHCAQPLMERLGTPATARASFALYNTAEEVDRLVRGLHDVRRIFA
ncbi:MAG: SufS family cysteine desulfurase [Alphaproteobacteria bacterium]|nr:SufS family cysteine desulfurase [Alphaproteobacteria bacterium]